MLKKNKGKLYQHSIREKIHIRQVNQELFVLNHTIIKLKRINILLIQHLIFSSVSNFSATGCKRKRGCAVLNCVRLVWGFCCFLCFHFTVIQSHKWRTKKDQCLALTNKNSKWLADSRWRQESGYEQSPESQLGTPPHSIGFITGHSPSARAWI